MQIYYPNTATTGELPTHPYTNDVGLGEVYDELAVFNKQYPSSQEECAVLVGAGGLLTMADVLPETIFVTDRQPALLEWVAKCTHTILDCASRDEFAKKLQAPYQGTEGDADVFGERHFLASPKRYAAARDSIGRKSVQYALLDYGQAGEIEQLAQTIAQQERTVRVFNATNMHRYIRAEHINTGNTLTLPAYVAALGEFSWSPDFRILSSAIDLLRVRSLPVQSSLAGYKAVIEIGHGEAEKHRRRNFFFRSRV
jgi:hypothetical protein